MSKNIPGIFIFVLKLLGIIQTVYELKLSKNVHLTFPQIGIFAVSKDSNLTKKNLFSLQ